MTLFYIIVAPLFIYFAINHFKRGYNLMGVLSLLIAAINITLVITQNIDAARILETIGIAVNGALIIMLLTQTKKMNANKNKD